MIVKAIYHFMIAHCQVQVAVNHMPLIPDQFDSVTKATDQFAKVFEARLDSFPIFMNYCLISFKYYF